MGGLGPGGQGSQSHQVEGQVAPQQRFAVKDFLAGGKAENGEEACLPVGHSILC